jgi:hypothetical protein
MLKTFVIAGAQQLTTEEVVGTSGRPDEPQLAESGCQDAAAADLAGEQLLSDGNIEILKNAHDLAMVRPEDCTAREYIKLLISTSPFCKV